MSRATVELDFFGMEKESSSKSQFQKFLDRQRSFRGRFDSQFLSLPLHIMCYAIYMPRCWRLRFFVCRYAEPHFQDQHWSSQIRDFLRFCEPRLRKRQPDSFKGFGFGAFESRFTCLYSYTQVLDNFTSIFLFSSVSFFFWNHGKFTLKQNSIPGLALRTFQKQHL